MKRISGIPEQFVVFLLFFIFFLFTLASNFSGPHDSIGYLNGIVHGNALFHQHHLIYHFVTHYWLVGAKAIFPGVADYFLVEAFTALWGAGSLTIAYCFLRNRFKLAPLVSFLTTAVIAFTYGVWFYSVNIEVYAPPMFFLLAALYVLSKKDFLQRDVWKVALLQSIAILFHQVHILFTVTILYLLWRQRRQLKLANAFFQYAAIGTVLVGGAYFMVGWVLEGQNSLAKWMIWMQGYAGSSDYWKSVSIETPAYVATGLSHAFIGGHFIFRLPGVNTYVGKATGEHSLADELYLVRDMGEGMAIFLSVVSLILAVMMILLVIKFFVKMKQVRKQWRYQITPMVITGIVYSVFFCFWEPEILEFWIFQTVLFWLVLLGTLSHEPYLLPFRIKPATGAALIALCLFIINYFGSVRYLLNLNNDLYYEKTAPIKDIVTPQDAVLLQDSWILKDFLEYYTDAGVKEVPQADTARAQVDNFITDHLQKGAKLYIYPEGRPAHSNTRYIDSVLAAYPGRHRVFHADHPRIIIVE